MEQKEKLLNDLTKSIDATEAFFEQEFGDPKLI